MRARKYSVESKCELAHKHLRRNASLLDPQAGQRLCQCAAVRSSVPYLIALDAIELEQVTDFQWSPFYSGTDFYSAVTANPVAEGANCEVLLATNLHRHTSARQGMELVLPDSMATRNDPWLSKIDRPITFCADRVYYVVPNVSSEVEWQVTFEDTFRFACKAGSFEVGFCTRACLPCEMEWTSEQLTSMIDSASCVFATALDGEGYLVWELTGN